MTFQTLVDTPVRTFDPATAGNYFRQGMSMRIRELESYLAPLSKPSKMPWLGWATSAKHCTTGSALRKVPGSVCEKCYAFRGNYQFPCVKDCHARRLSALTADVDRWAGYMAALILLKAAKQPIAKRYFRWHDSGDIQSRAHYHAIVWIAYKVPAVRFYIPTKETRYAREHARTPYGPSNLVLRLSAPMVGQQPNRPFTYPGLSCTVGAATGFLCPAQDNDGACGACRACWDPTVGNVDYALH